jgi:hypothetical protein
MGTVERREQITLVTHQREVAVRLGVNFLHQRVIVRRIHHDAR